MSTDIHDISCMYSTFNSIQQNHKNNKYSIYTHFRMHFWNFGTEFGAYLLLLSIINIETD